MTILVIGKRRRPIRMGCCSGMSSSQRWARPLPSEGKGHTFESCRVRHFAIRY